MSFETIWTVADNSGIKTVKQLKIKKIKCKVAKPGDIMTVFPRKFKFIKKVQRQKYLGMVLTIKRKLKRSTGMCIKGHRNTVVLMTMQKKIIASRIAGLAYKEVRQRRNSYVYKRVFARIGQFL